MLQLKRETAHTPFLGGLAQILGRWRHSVNICCLNSGWVRFSKSKCHSSLGTMQAWFPTGEPVHGCGSCPPTSLPTGFSEWGLSHVSHAWNGSPQAATCILHRTVFLIGEGIPGASLDCVGKGWRDCLPLGVLKGMDFKAKTCYSSKIMWPLNKRLSFFSTKPLPLECMGSRQQNPEWLYGNRSRLYFVFILHYRVFHINIACS